MSWSLIKRCLLLKRLQSLKFFSLLISTMSHTVLKKSFLHGRGALAVYVQLSKLPSLSTVKVRDCQTIRQSLFLLSYCQVVRLSNCQTTGRLLVNYQTVRLEDWKIIKHTDYQTVILSNYKNYSTVRLWLCQTIRISNCETVRQSDYETISI